MSVSVAPFLLHRSVDVYREATGTSHLSVSSLQ